ncbi:MAG: hypothetical protein J07HQW2_00019 [Haloquadratum walsbyi J07HQW2]|uniref:Uncharacterized protein n=1 Tax=Haloquadratum walsbyi J07HQW2 TaxID=1238425 RepID=U1PMW5_9EURY|nr:MAG: hypothetical protein J07HQW2_00019 [Haloquadratum walsbyi J07HQW2]
MGAFVDVAGKGVALFGRPGLLVTGLAAVVLGKRCHCARPLRVVCLEVALVDTPATPRRDIAVVGLNRILLETPITGEMSGVLSEHAFVDIVEGGLSVDVVGDDPGPVVATAVAGNPLGESLKLAGCISLVVPALTTAASPCPEDTARTNSRATARYVLQTSSRRS